MFPSCCVITVVSGFLVLYRSLLLSPTFIPAGMVRDKTHVYHFKVSLFTLSHNAGIVVRRAFRYQRKQGPQPIPHIGKRPECTLLNKAPTITRCKGNNFDVLSVAMQGSFVCFVSLSRPKPKGLHGKLHLRRFV